MHGILLGYIIAECQTHWQESSEDAENKVLHGLLLGNVTAEC